MIIIDWLYSIIGTPLGYIMWVCYLLVNNFGWAIIIFTLIVKAAMFPLNLKQQKNMAKSQLFMPRVKEIQTKYRNNQQKQQEELAKLQKEGYSPAGGCGTMLLTMLLLFGVIDVVYKPMTHMEHLDWGNSGSVTSIVARAKQVDYATTILASEEDLKIYLEYLDNPSTLTIMTQETIDKLTEEAKSTAVVQEQVVIDNPEFNLDEAKDAIVYTKENVMATYGLTAEQWEKLNTIDDDTITALTDGNSRLSSQIKSDLNVTRSSDFASLRQELTALRGYTNHKESFSDLILTQETFDKLENLSNNMNFLGIDLGATPNWGWDSTVIVPILSFLLSLAQTIISQIIQKKTNPEMAAQQGGGMKMFMYIMPLFSLWIAFTVPAGVGMYWAVSYFFSIIQSIVTYKVWPTEKLKAKAAEEMKAKKLAVEATATVTDVDDKGNTVTRQEKLSNLSQKELKEYQRKKIEEARRQDALKYGDEDIPDLPPLDEDKNDDLTDDKE